jgi:hypothetical protein
MADDMRAFGLEDEIADVPVGEEAERECFELWRENRDTLEVFLALATQWDLNADGVRTNIKYAVLPTIERYKPDIALRKWPRIFNEIRIMEAAALEVIREQWQAQLDKQTQY